MFFLGSCTRRETAVSEGLRTQTLHFANDGEPDSLDPHVIIGTAASKIAAALFEGLVNIANDGVTILPGVAERWEKSADETIYTFHLRPDAKWSNGDVVEAKDFVESFRRILEPTLGGPTPNVLFPIVGAQAYHTSERSRDFSAVGVRASDARTLVVKLESRTPYFLFRLANVPTYPVHLRSVDRFKGHKQRAPAWTKPGNLVSNGPFYLTSWEPEHSVIVQKNPHYWDRARVRLREIRFYPFPDKSTEERAFRSGQLHITDDVPVTKRVVYRDRHAPEFRDTPLADTEIIIFNTTKPPFNVAPVRRAFSMAIDRQAIVGGVLGGFAAPARTLTPAGMGGYQPAHGVDFDPAGARRLLAEAGFPGGAKFPVVEWNLPGNNSVLTRVAEAVQEMWRKELGITVNLSTTEWNVLRDNRRTKNFQISYIGFDFWISDPVDLIEIATSHYPGNYAGFASKAYDRAFKDSEVATTDAERYAAFDAMENLIVTEAPYVPLYHPKSVRLVHTAVRGWRANPINRIDWRELWLDPPK